MARFAIITAPLNSRRLMRVGWVAHQVRKNWPNGAKGDGAAVVAEQRPIQVDVLAGMLEHRETEGQTSFASIVRSRQSGSAMIEQLLPQMFEAAPLEVVLASIVSIEG